MQELNISNEKNMSIFKDIELLEIINALYETYWQMKKEQRLNAAERILKSIEKLDAIYLKSSI